MRNRMKKRTNGQALVEFALASTIIFFMLSATVDLGLIFLNLQGVRAAAQEGATFGSFVVDNVINQTEIRNRTRLSLGTAPPAFTNLLDLNSDGINDSTQATILTSYITVETVYANGTIACTAAQIAAKTNCSIKVTVYYDYKIFFPFTPAFADKVKLRAALMMPLR